MSYFKKASFLVTFILFSLLAYSQVDKDTVAKAPASAKPAKRYFNSIYGDVLTDVLVSPYTVVPNYVENTNSSYPYTYMQQGNYGMQMTGVNLASFGYKGWYNIVEFSGDASVSLGAWPILSFGLGIGSGRASDNVGFMNFQIPVLAEFHYGNGATCNASKELGLTIGGGIEFVKCPLFNTNNKPLEFTSQGGGIMTVDVTTAWLEPCLDIGVTFWTKSNNAIEIIAKYGFGNRTSFVGDDGIAITSGGSNTYALGAILYIGY